MTEICSPQSPSLIRVLVASGCPAMLEGLASILQRSSHIKVIGRELGVAGALRSAVNLKPDVTILDWQLDGGPGTAAPPGLKFRISRLPQGLRSLRRDPKRSHEADESGSGCSRARFGKTDDLMQIDRT